MSVLLLWIGLAIVAASIGSIVLVSGLALWVGSATVIEQAEIIWRRFTKVLPPTLLGSLAVGGHGLGGLAIGYHSTGWWAVCVALTWVVCGFDLRLLEFVLRSLDRRNRLP